MFHGTYTALVTPMRERAPHHVDVDALRHLVEEQIENGIDGLVPCGTTGEAVTLHEDEWALVVQTTLDQAAGRVPVVPGTGSNATDKTIHFTRRAKAMGCQGALIVTPYYNRPTPAAQEAHYRAVLAEVSIPTIVYNVPSRTGTNMTPETIIRLADHPDIVAVKEASGNVWQTQEIVVGAGDKITVLSGDDNLALALFAVGAKGLISVSSNVAPRLTGDIYRAYASGDTAGATKAGLRLYGLMKNLFVESNPVPAKAALALLGKMSDAVRLPLIPASDKTRTLMQSELTTLGLL